MFADLHIHSRFSYATSKFLDIHNLVHWASLKGLDLVASADITQPIWRDELRENLLYNEDTGFYEYKNSLDFAQYLPKFVMQNPPNLATFQAPSFILQTEISCVYRQKDRLRKVHCLLFFPNFTSAEMFSQSLQKLAPTCNFASDGRPTVKLSAKILLDLALECKAEFIPAHIWTPHFSLFGSKSGFDSIQECFEDLSEEIFALETGLSSDPQMNSLISQLDAYSLISNSDAHSAENLARELNIFSGEVNYDSLFLSLKKSKQVNNKQLSCKFEGTLEFYAQEGKYYHDGHRDCKINFSPKQSLELNNICPVCNKKLTLGVLHRVHELADRETAPAIRNYKNILPLAELIAKAYSYTKSSKKVQDIYFSSLAKLGSELAILEKLELEQIAYHDNLLAQIIAKMRNNQLQILAGYDGEYGQIY